MHETPEVARCLREIAALLAFLRAPRFRSLAYERAAEIVLAVGDVGPLVEDERLEGLEGIGTALAKQITELWHTGTSEYLTSLRAQAPPGTAELVEVEGMSPKRIVQLHDALGIRSVADLHAACAEGKVRKVRGFGAKTEARLLDASARFLARREQDQPKTILARALAVAQGMQFELSGGCEETHLAGDIRRGEETTNQLELVAIGAREPVLARLAESAKVLRLDREENVAYLGQGMTLRVHVTERKQLGSALIQTTGNEEHLRKLRELAAALGVDLDRQHFATEASLYGELGLSLIPPELRRGLNELELAHREDFSDLLRVVDLKGAVHCHTTYSDGRNSVLEMARAAEELGLKYITITDHSPSAHYAQGASIDQLKVQWAEIARAQEQVGVRILKGTESDILADGALDYPDSILEQFDVVIASIHRRYRQGREQMTDRLRHALSLPLFKIWGHPLGRILNHRAPIDCDVLPLLDVLATSARGALEINADPHRLDLFEPWISAAREREIPFVISSDAHSTSGLSNARFGVIMARRAGVRRGEVLNALSSEQFVQRARGVAAQEPS